MELFTKPSAVETFYEAVKTGVAQMTEARQAGQSVAWLCRQQDSRMARAPLSCNARLDSTGAIP